VSAPVVGQAAPPLSGTTAKGDPFDLSAPRERSILIEFHRGTW
jgi:hypothetical protein